MTRLRLSIAAALVAAVIVATGIVGAAVVTPPPDALERLWAVCVRNEEPECIASPSPSQTAAPTASTSPAPTASPSSIGSPSPTATPTPIPTATPSTTPSAVPSSAPSGSITIESQGWWNKSGISVPDAPGHHIHVQATVPAPGRIQTGVVNVPVRLTLHDQVGEPNFIRWQDGSDTKGRIDVSQSDFTCTTHTGDLAFTDCHRDMVLPIDFGGFGTGLRELRISLNVPDEQPDGLPGSDSGDQRMYQSYGIPVCVRACSPVAVGGRSLTFLEARGWYEGHDYSNARLTTAVSTVRSCGTIGVSLKPGSGGDPTRFSGIYIDPDMHRHNAGIVVQERNGPFTGSVTLPCLPAGPHKLTLITSDGQNAGVLVVPFVVP